MLAGASNALSPGRLVGVGALGDSVRRAHPAADRAGDARSSRRAADHAAERRLVRSDEDLAAERRSIRSAEDRRVAGHRPVRWDVGRVVVVRRRYSGVGRAVARRQAD